jgi:hypothetical protein
MFINNEGCCQPQTLAIMKLVIVCIFFILSNLALAETEPTLTGRYEYRTDPESWAMLDGLVCFYPNEESVKFLPRPKTYQRLSWFCFRNVAESKKLLGITTKNTTTNCGMAGTASVKASDYEPYLGEGGNFDTAILQSVISNSNVKDISCK